MLMFGEILYNTRGIVKADTEQTQVYTSTDDTSFTTHLVKFHSNGGEDVISQVIYDGDKLHEYAPPIKENAAFIGWYMDETLTQPFSYDMKIQSDLDLYAKWEKTNTQEQSYIFGDGNYGLRIVVDRTIAKIGDTIICALYNNGSKNYRCVELTIECNSDDFSFYNWDSGNEREYMLALGNEEVYYTLKPTSNPILPGEKIGCIGFKVKKKFSELSVTFKDGEYTATVEDKVKDFFTVTKSATDPYKFTIKAVALKENSKVSGKISIICEQNGKKVNFTATAVNGIKKVELAKPSGVTLDSDTDNIKIAPSKTDKENGTVSLQLEKASSSFETTETPKIYTMGIASGYDTEKFAAGSVSIKKKPSTAQKKITASISSDKKSVNISAAKGTAAGITTYFLLVYNTSDTAEKKGYKVFSVTTAE